jgi:hypothetical protein
MYGRYVAQAPSVAAPVAERPRDAPSPSQASLDLLAISDEAIRQGRLAGTVLAQECVHLAGAHVGADVVQGLDARNDLLMCSRLRTTDIALLGSGLTGCGPWHSPVNESRAICNGRRPQAWIACAGTAGRAPAEDSGGWKITVAPTPSGARVAPGDPIDVGTGAVYDLQPEGSSALAQDESGDHVVNVALEQAP